MGTFPKQGRDVSSKDIDGISDLVVWAPIKDGFVDAFSNVTYESRLRVVAEALHNIRKSVREHELLEPFSDTAKRILSLLDFRIGIVDRDVFEAEGPSPDNPTGARPRKYMYLVATFDGPWEPYMRLIWYPLGAFLDLVLCNCDGYKPAAQNDFETYAQWVRDHQLNSAIFYSTSGLSVKDKIYLSELEEIQRTHTAGDSFEKIARLTSGDPDSQARAIREDDYYKWDSLRLAFEALNVLYKLTDYYPADALGEDGDGRYLLRAAQSLLNFYDYDFSWLPDDLEAGLKQAYAKHLNWFSTPVPEQDTQVENGPRPKPSEIQKGILSGYNSTTSGKGGVSHGVLLFIRIDDPERVRAFLKMADWSWERAKKKSGFATTYWDSIITGIAFAYSGLERLGVPGDELRKFPKEFRQGMSERAPMLGDKFRNHPRRWKLPVRNWPASFRTVSDSPGETDQKRPPIELSEIDFVIQARSGKILTPDIEGTFRKFDESARRLVNLPKASAPEAELKKRFEEQYGSGDKSGQATRKKQPPGAFDWLFEQCQDAIKQAGEAQDQIASPLDVFVAFVHYLGQIYGFRILGLENMYSLGAGDDKAAGKVPVARDHFGFRDGISQPVIDYGDGSDLGQSEVLPGDILYGYRNTRGDGYKPEYESRLMFNGTFMALRKIAQDVRTFRQFEDDHADIRLADNIMGRTKDGDPLVDPGDETNDFTYETDRNGERCPFAAHIRLANPRGGFHGRKDPMILRRGMSYGPRFDPDSAETPDEAADRGIMFIAYCASLAEQYEIVQRWLNVGNATDTYSGQNDPLTGVMPKDGPRVFRYISDDPKSGSGQVVQAVQIDKPFTTLEYGHYFFVPSRKALQTIAKAGQAEDSSNWRIGSGKAIIRQIEALPEHRQQEEWKRVLEDFLTKDPTEHDITPRVWEAIQDMGGAYRIDAGVAYDDGSWKSAQPVVLVTDYDEIYRILRNRCDEYVSPCVRKTRPFSSKEQDQRIGSPDSFGRIYVAMDAPCPHATSPAYDESDYAIESKSTNEYIMAQSHGESFKTGYAAGTQVLGRFKGLATGLGLARLKEYQSGGNINPPEGPLQFKVELGQQYIEPALAIWCKEFFGVPDGKHILPGSWTWEDVSQRNPVCPGDFLATSRHTFYPRPNKSITRYAFAHGKRLRAAVDKYISLNWRKEDFIRGKIASQMHKYARQNAEKNTSPANVRKQKDILARNLVGIMIGAIPPMDANLRWTMFDWLEDETIWRHQHDYLAAKSEAGAYEAAKKALMPALERAMCIRPAPDLIYRTVEHDEVPIGKIKARKDDLVILCLPAPMQQLVRDGKPDVALVFGGDRKTGTGGSVMPQHPMHACPAQDMAMGGMLGIIAALFDAGRIQALPASLIVRISDWLLSEDEKNT